jgi:DNA-binding MarR family transcriptional regulator
MPAPVADRAIPALTDDYTAWLITSLAMRLSRGASGHYTREFGLGSTEYRIVMALGRAGTCKGSQVAAAADVDKAAASRSLRALAGLGVVGIDRLGREVAVHLTPAGTALHARLRAASRRRDKRLTRGMSAAEVQRLRADLLHLIDNLAYMNQP